MTKSKPVCFISYSHEDVDHDTLAYLCSCLTKQVGGEYDVLVDRDLRYGSDLDKFMELLSKQVDVVVILMTPSYKKKVLERRGGVYEEYKRIIFRYQQSEKEKRKGKKSGEIEGYFFLVPILFAGTHESSVPEEIRNLKYLNLVGLRATRGPRGRFQVSDYVAQKYMPEIRKIVASILVIRTLKSGSFEELYREYFARLFRELKADWDNPRDRDHNYVETLFVKTHAYRKVERQEVYFLIGRKGSGKTTIRDVLALTHRDKYIGHVAVVADDFNLEGLYSLFSSGRIRSDTKSVFSRLESFSLAWEAFIAICCMDVLLAQRANLQLTRYQKRRLKPIADFLHDFKRTANFNNPIDKNAAFFFCFGSIIRFMEDCIEKARSDERYFLSDIQACFNRSRFLEATFGREVIYSFYGVLETFRRNFLVSLDGFDSAFDDFRRASIHRAVELEQKALFEIDWLRSFVQLALRMKQKPEVATPLYSHIDLCVTVPEDRFFEVGKSDRDSYRLHSRFLSLRWSGIELAILLRKRLEELTQASTDKSKSPEERLEQFFKQHLKHIPIEVTVDFNERNYQLPLFAYVLGHTFWRPREILLYYAQIIAVAEDLRKKGERVTSEIICRTVRDITHHIIQGEFIGEFVSTVVNIHDIVSAFERQKQVLSYAEVSRILQDIDFRFATGAIDAFQTDNKIDFLYHIGFLGICADNRMMKRFNLITRHAFCFNEGYAPVDAIGKTGFSDYTFIIHPIFSEYLDLDTSKNELILQSSWGELHAMESCMA